MKNENDAIKKLTSFKSKVSCHYFIKSNGKILTLVPDLYIAWHAGISSWKNKKHLNKNSIGIEINNPGHNSNYKKFSKKQINSIIKLSKYLIKNLLNLTIEFICFFENFLYAKLCPGLLISIPIEFLFKNFLFFQDETPACQAIYNSGTKVKISPLFLTKK